MHSPSNQTSSVLGHDQTWAHTHTLLPGGPPVDRDVCTHPATKPALCLDTSKLGAHTHTLLPGASWRRRHMRSSQQPDQFCVGNGRTWGTHTHTHSPFLPCRPLCEQRLHLWPLMWLLKTTHTWPVSAEPRRGPASRTHAHARTAGNAGPTMQTAGRGVLTTRSLVLKQAYRDTRAAAPTSGTLSSCHGRCCSPAGPTSTQLLGDWGKREGGPPHGSGTRH